MPDDEEEILEAPRRKSTFTFTPPPGVSQRQLFTKIILVTLLFGGMIGIVQSLSHIPGVNQTREFFVASIERAGEQYEWSPAMATEKDDVLLPGIYSLEPSVSWYALYDTESKHIMNPDKIAQTKLVSKASETLYFTHSIPFSTEGLDTLTILHCSLETIGHENAMTVKNILDDMDRIIRFKEPFTSGCISQRISL